MSTLAAGMSGESRRPERRELAWVEALDANMKHHGRAWNVAILAVSVVSVIIALLSAARITPEQLRAFLPF